MPNPYELDIILADVVKDNEMIILDLGLPLNPIAVVLTEERTEIIYRGGHVKTEIGVTHPKAMECLELPEATILLQNLSFGPLASRT